ncbi:C2H2 zinc finger protein [Reticulomyxa filosa]|uniref:C2H2 zinc finger protein n=1 Tax=Reticulomyxa filosa TaxID=46433 RepID=X6NSB9_RETFI|nr:C2H2 zinc finger protein [Reticulomyxa filosa]|eukprot:ETO28639.1 C2H2 zinc finger protein [Reticulomyxa filosa]
MAINCIPLGQGNSEFSDRTININKNIGATHTSPVSQGQSSHNYDDITKSMIDNKNSDKLLKKDHERYQQALHRYKQLSNNVGSNILGTIIEYNKLPLHSLHSKILTTAKQHPLGSIVTSCGNNSSSSVNRKPASLHAWGVSDVLLWLTSFPTGKCYITEFARSGVSGRLLEQMDNKTLQSLGVSIEVHRQEILARVTFLKPLLQQDISTLNKFKGESTSSENGSIQTKAKASFTSWIPYRCLYCNFLTKCQLTCVEHMTIVHKVFLPLTLTNHSLSILQSQQNQLPSTSLKTCFISQEDIASRKTLSSFSLQKNSGTINSPIKKKDSNPNIGKSLKDTRISFLDCHTPIVMQKNSNNQTNLHIEQLRFFSNFYNSNDNTWQCITCNDRFADYQSLFSHLLQIHKVDLPGLLAQTHFFHLLPQKHSKESNLSNDSWGTHHVESNNVPSSVRNEIDENNHNCQNLQPFVSGLMIEENNSNNEQMLKDVLSVSSNSKTNKPYSCPHCNKKYTILSNLNKHITKKHLASKILKHAASESGHGDNTNAGNQHNTGVNKDYNLHCLQKCDMCGKAFKSGMDLIAHVAVEHAPTI